MSNEDPSGSSLPHYGLDDSRCVSPTDNFFLNSLAYWETLAK